MILEFKSTLPGGSGERFMTRDLESTFGSMSVKDVLLSVVCHFLLEDVKSASNSGKSLEVDFSESKTYYDCNESILEEAINLLSDEGALQIMYVERVRKGRKKAVLRMLLRDVA